MSEEAGNEVVTATNEVKETPQVDTAPEQTQTEDAPETEQVEGDKQETSEKPDDEGKKDELEGYEFNVEGLDFSEEQKKASIELMKTFGVTNKEQADNLVNFMKRYEEARVSMDKQNTEDMLSNWDKVLDEDKDFSRDYDKNIALANNALKRYGTDELDKWLSETGFNRHPEIVKMFYRIGKDLEEAKVLTGSNAAEKLKHDKYGNPLFNFNKSFGDK